MNEKNNTGTAPFDFDYWADLASSDPERFEAEKLSAINSLISSSPRRMQKRLRGLQWRIDMEIRRGKNSLDGCLRVHRMMIEQVYAAGGLVDSLYRLGTPEAPLPRANTKQTGAVVIPFSTVPRD